MTILALGGLLNKNNCGILHNSLKKSSSELLLGILKLVYLYSDILISKKLSIENDEFVTILSKNYENSLFITNEDLYIIGVCGQYSFNINYLELNHTLKNIYVLSSSNNFSYYVNKFKTCSDKIKCIGNIDNTYILKKYNILTEKCCELEEKKMISENVVNDFIKFTKNYQDIDAQKITKNDIMLMMYNNRKKIKFEP